MTFAVLAWLGAVGLSFTGWGWGVRRLFRMNSGTWPVTLCLGVAAVVVLGGLLNDLALAYPAALALAVLMGLGLALAELRQRFRTPAGLVRAASDALARHRWMVLVSLGLPLAIAITATVLLVPPSAYNFGDDFQKYFAYPVRMLETGTLFGSTLNSMGAETLGGQSFLDGFAVAALPIADINVVDSIFGLALCLLLAGGSIAHRKELAAVGVAAVAAVVFINPQIVNISSLYLGAAMMAAAVALTCDPREEPKPAALGLLYATLIALKPTFALFVVLHAIFTAGAVATSRGRAKYGAQWLAIAAGSGLVFVLPWLLLHAGNYFAVPAPHETLVPAPKRETLDLLSTTRTAYGAAMLHYLVAVAAAVIAAGFASWSARKTPTPRPVHAVLAAGLTLLAAYILMLTVAGPQLAGYYMALRYFTPFAIGLVPIICGFAALQSSEGNRPALCRWLPLGLTIVPLVAFAPSLITRSEQAWRIHNVLAFSTLAQEPHYLDYSRYALWGGAADRVKMLQDMVPAGEPIVAWINQPFLLDYERNPITDVNVAGLNTPWADLPKADYVIWEYLGYASPRYPQDIAHVRDLGVHEWMITARAMKFAERLRDLSATAEPIYNDGSVAVFKLHRASSPETLSP